MPRELIAQAREQAAFAVTPVRAAALLHIARVLTVLNPNEAKELFDRALADIATLSGMDRQALQEEACMISAAVAPERAPDLATGYPFVNSRIVEIMMEHGNIEAAISLLLTLAGTDYPYWSVLRVLESCKASSTTNDPDTGTTVRDDDGIAPQGPRIRCPRCNWSPRAGDVWSCKCGHVWNTFDTGGICPQCMHQWTSTQCLNCHQWSAHSDWYVY